MENINSIFQGTLLAQVAVFVPCQSKSFLNLFPVLMNLSDFVFLGLDAESPGLLSPLAGRYLHSTQRTHVTTSAPNSAQPIKSRQVGLLNQKGSYRLTVILTKGGAIDA